MAKYIIRQPRYLHGKYYHASAHEPKVVDIELPKGVLPDAGLEPYQGGEGGREALRASLPAGDAGAH
jgi:hypothetical protein